MSILTATLFCLAPCSCSAQKVDNSTVGSLDLNRYLGSWYEIARYDHSFERGLTHAKAHYSLKADGTITVINSGIKKGQSKTSIGKAKVMPARNEDTNSKKVSIALRPLGLSDSTIVRPSLFTISETDLVE